MGIGGEMGTDRWVLLGGLTLRLGLERAISECGSFWMSEMRHLEKEFGNDEDSVMSELFSVCDGRKCDAYVESVSMNAEEEDMFMSVWDKTSEGPTGLFAKTSLKVYFWLNFSMDILTRYNCNRGVLTLTNSVLSYDVIYHLRGTFKCSVGREEGPFSRPSSLFDFFRRAILELGVLEGSESSAENSAKLTSRCEVLNCLDHLSFCESFDVRRLSIRGIIEYLGNEMCRSRLSERAKDRDGILKFAIQNYDDIYSYFSNENELDSQCASNSFAESVLSMDIWFKVMDYLDLETVTNLGRLNKKMYYIWLVYYRNLLLPHQRKSVSLLLKRENAATFECCDCGWTYDKDWFYNNQIRFVTSSEDYFKCLSIWHYLKVKDMSGTIESRYLGDVVWSEDRGGVNLLRGVRVHPKEMDRSVSSSIFNDDNREHYDVCLYLNHANKRIHLGYRVDVKPGLEGNKSRYVNTNGGVFCDEPGLGKTLTVLSLIEKTASCESNVKDNEDLYRNDIEYPTGVYNFLSEIRDGSLSFVYKIPKDCNGRDGKVAVIDDVKDVKRTLLPSRSTLIVVPNHLVQHWINEINKWYGTEEAFCSTADRTGLEYDAGLSRLGSQGKTGGQGQVWLGSYPRPERRISHDLHSAGEMEWGGESRVYPTYYVYDDPSCDSIPESGFIADSDIVVISYRMLTRQYQLCKVRREYRRASVGERSGSRNAKERRLGSECDNDNESVFIENKSPLLGVKWYRLVVDEGHNIGNSEITSKLYQQFISRIKSDYKWIMSGTPLPVSLFKSLGTSIQNVFNFLNLPVMYSKVLDRRDASTSFKRRGGRLTLRYERTDSLFTFITKTALNIRSTNPMGLFALVTQLGSIVVYTNKKSCIRNCLPGLIGPVRKVIRPCVRNEFFVYNMLAELTQRNLFCTYYSGENVDSLLHPNNANYRQEVIWNLRFSSVLGFALNLRDYIMDEDKLELIKAMDFSIPSIHVSDDSVCELRLMLENRHELYENECYYEPNSPLRLDFVLDYYKNLRLVGLEGDKSEFRDDFGYYKCDSCSCTTMFPLIIPCPRIHM
ncbi:hypothetical protein FG386_002396, partial [Cryptosporidium ryanae]|uniref:uncharacterized protein n=1 Tax=Cryptosporidium ryanae TaxID=515981 RepID=UPI00351A443A